MVLMGAEVIFFSHLIECFNLKEDDGDDDDDPTDV